MIKVYGKNGNYIGWIDTDREGELVQEYDGQHIEFHGEEVFHEEFPDPDFTVEFDEEQLRHDEETELYANDDGCIEMYDPTDDY